MKTERPDYILIFKDIISENCPERKNEFEMYLTKEILSVIDIIELNNRIFGLSDRQTINFNQQHRSYDNETIVKILKFQKEQKLNNSQLARRFKLSRNTVTKWKRIYKNI